jgi:hypothetical protein
MCVVKAYLSIVCKGGGGGGDGVVGMQTIYTENKFVKLMIIQKPTRASILFLE